MHENFLEWEEEYKRKKIQQMRDQVVREVRDEYEQKIEELIDREREKMQHQYQQSVQDTIALTKEEADIAMQDKM